MTGGKVVDFATAAARVRLARLRSPVDPYAELWAAQLRLQAAWLRAWCWWV